jgi:hypothetical protein
MFQGIYGDHYDPKTKIATWHCPQEENKSADGCMFVGDSTSEIELLQSVQIDDGGILRTYVATSANGHQPDCHACAPIIGMAVFSYSDSKWHLDSANPNVTRRGAWAKPPDATLIRIGPHLYGFMLTLLNGGQGYFTTACTLIAAKEKTANVVWEGIMSEDNSGDYDPTGQYGSKDRIHVTAAYKFNPTNSKSDYYELEMISRGRGYGSSDKLVSQSWVEVYRFKSGKYQLVKRTDYRELVLPKR